MKKVSIQGIRGAFHEEAARRYFGPMIQILPKLDFNDTLQSVAQNEADYAVMAVENSIAGTIHSNYSLLQSSGLSIQGEVYLRIRQNLMALPESKIEAIERVYSHPMAIAQCRNFFESRPQIQLIESEDTALSAREIAKNKQHNVAAIAGKLAGKIYGLELLAQGIETHRKNYTRFLIIGRKCLNQIYNKASLVFSLPHKQGALAGVLSLIAQHSINLTKIESVPVVGEPWHYRFYLDISFEKKASYHSMLQEIRPHCQNFQLLGSYLKAEMPAEPKMETS